MVAPLGPPLSVALPWGSRHSRVKLFSAGVRPSRALLFVLLQVAGRHALLALGGGKRNRNVLLLVLGAAGRAAADLHLNFKLPPLS